MPELFVFIECVFMCFVMDGRRNEPLIEERDSNDQTQLARLCASVWGEASGPPLTAQRDS